MPDEAPPPPSSEILIYQTEDGQSRIQVRLDGNTVWLTQRLLSELFDKDVRTINEHLQNIFAEGELDPEATIRKFRIVQIEGAREVTRIVDHYNLDVVLAVGYRVRSHRGTQFRRWATEHLREYLVKGFTLDDQRLKEGRSLGTDYFDELLERIRDIRASEKRFYQKIRDLYALSADYDAATQEIQQFFQIVQNKLHWAISSRTTAGGNDGVSVVSPTSMITFRCTQKARKLLGVRDTEIEDGVGQELHEWFVDAATFDRRRCLLFTNRVTLYSFWVPGVRKADAGRLGDLFEQNLIATMARDGFTESETELLLRDQFRFAKTNDRAVTGSMNDHIQCSRWYFETEGRSERADVGAINGRLNRTPMGALAPGQHMDFPIDVLARIVRPAGAT